VYSLFTLSILFTSSFSPLVVINGPLREKPEPTVPVTIRPIPSIKKLLSIQKDEYSLVHVDTNVCISSINETLSVEFY